MTTLYNKNIAEYLLSNNETRVYTPNILDGVIASGLLKSKFGFDVTVLNNIYEKSFSGAICIRIPKNFAKFKNCLIIDIENIFNENSDVYNIIDTNKLSATALIAELFSINIPRNIIRIIDKINHFDLKTETIFEFLAAFFMEWHKKNGSIFFKFASEQNWPRMLKTVKELYSQFITLKTKVKIRFNSIFRSDGISAYDLCVDSTFKEKEYLLSLCAIKSMKECTISEINVIFYDNCTLDNGLNNVISNNMFLCAREQNFQLKIISELKQFLASVTALPNLSVLKFKKNTKNNTRLKKTILYEIQKIIHTEKVKRIVKPLKRG